MDARKELAAKAKKVAAEAPIRERARERQGTRSDLCQNSDKSEAVDTKKELARMAGHTHGPFANIGRR